LDVCRSAAYVHQVGRGACEREIRSARDRKLREVRQLLSQRPPPGTDRESSSPHSDIIKATTGEDVSEGDGLVLRPFGDGRFKVLDHIHPDDLK
jgi:hypothetical protein